MTTDAMFVLLCLVTTILGLALFRSWLENVSDLLWMLVLSPGPTIGSSLAAAAVVFTVTVILHPGDGVAATRLLAVLFFAPIVARPMTDASAWAIGPRTARPEVQPVLCEMSIQLVVYLLAAALILLLTYAWVGPLKIVAGIAFSLSAAPFLAKPMIHLLEKRLQRFGERQSTKAFVFDQAALNQQAAFILSLSSPDSGELGDPSEMFTDDAAPLQPVTQAAKAAKRRVPRKAKATQ